MEDKGVTRLPFVRERRFKPLSALLQCGAGRSCQASVMVKGTLNTFVKCFAVIRATSCSVQLRRIKEV